METVVVCCKNHMKDMNAPCGQISEFLLCCLATCNNQYTLTSGACLLLVETVETPNDGGGGDSAGENQQVNGEAQDKCILQDAEMEEGNLHSTCKNVLSY